MATQVVPPPPPGFQLVNVPPPPPGFEVVGGRAAPSTARSVTEFNPSRDLPPLRGTPEHDEWRKTATPLSEAPEFEGRLPDRVVRQATEIPSRLKDVSSRFTTELKERPVETLLSAADAPRDILTQLVGGALGEPAALVTPDPTATRKFFEHQPQGAAGRAAGEGMGALFAPVGELVQAGGRGVAEVTGMSPERGEAAINTALMAAPFVKGGPKAPSKPAPKTKVSETPVESLRAAGFKFRPSDVRALEPGRKQSVASTAERLGGSETLRKSILLENQSTATKLATEELGLPKGTVRITPSTLDKLRAPEIKVYGDVGQTVGKFQPSAEFSAALDAVPAKLGLDPKARRAIARDVEQYRLVEGSGPDAVKTISALRRRAARERQSKDVSVQDQGDAHMAVADALEAELGRQLAARGDTNLVNKFQTARERLAKIHNVESVTVAGQIDATIMKRLRDKGAPLSGRLAVIADAAEYLPNVTQHARTVTNLGEEGALARMGEAVTGGFRKALESDRFQNRFGREAEALGPEGALADYFPKREFRPTAPPRERFTAETPEAPQPPVPPTQASGQLRAQQMAGDLELLPEQFPNAVEAAPTRARPGDLTLADDFVPEGVPFRGAAPSLADELSAGLDFAPETTGRGVPFAPSPAPRAPGMSQEVPGTSVFPELRAVRGRPDEVTGELSLADELSGQRPAAAVVESADNPGFFEVRTPGEKSATLVEGRERAQALADELFGVQPKRRPPALRTSIATKVDKPKIAFRKGEGGERIVESDVGKITMYEHGNAFQIVDSIVDEASRGKGHGVALMEEAIRRAGGKPLKSDTKVSSDAARLYDALERRGYEVIRNEFEKDADGNLVSTNSLRPVFEVRGKKQDGPR